MRYLKFVFLTAAFASVSVAQEAGWSDVEKIFGKKGAVQGSVEKFVFPRTDLSVTVGVVQVDAGLVLTSWIAFENMGDHTMVMGDLALLDKEVEPVVRQIVDHGLEVTAIHNHILNESPSIKYLHFGGQGDAGKLAQTMKTVLQVTGTPLHSSASSQQGTEEDWSGIESILGRKGTHLGKLLLFGIPRSEKIVENEMEIPPFMGMATSVNFQKVGEKVASTGDFVLTADEVNPVVKALTEHGIAVTALHSHMLFESPRLFFLHFWGYDSPEKVAGGIKEALDRTSVVKPG